MQYISVIVKCSICSYPLTNMILGEHIGAGPILPFLDPALTGQNLLNGANFASAGIGILNDTGIQFVS